MILAFLCAYAFREAFQEVYQKEAWMVFKAILISSFLLGFGVFTLKFQFVSRIIILFFLRLSSDPHSSGGSAGKSSVIWAITTRGTGIF
jgi:hypothetical protein